MRILAITNLYPNAAEPARGVFNRLQIDALSKRHQVEVIAPVAWTHGWRRRSAYRDAAAGPAPVSRPTYWFPPRIGRGWYGQCCKWSIGRQFRQAIRRLNPDLVYAAWAYPDGWAAVELAHAAGLPAVVKVHGSDVLALPDHPPRRRGTAEALCRAEIVIAVSRDLAERCVALGVRPRRVRVVRDGVDISQFHPGAVEAARRRLALPADEPIVLFVGHLERVKAPDVLLAATRILVQRGIRFTCHIIGEGRLSATLRAEVEPSELRARVRFHGALPHEALPDWFRAADVVALPSRSEGVPCVLLEAAACGRPFVASRVGGIPEIADLMESRLVPPGDADAVASAIADRLAGRWGDGRAARAALRSHTDAADDLTQAFESAIRLHRGEREPVIEASPLARAETSRCTCTECHNRGKCPRRGAVEKNLLDSGCTKSARVE